jgi:uncharacterized ParB-like nuclease family protein
MKVRDCSKGLQVRLFADCHRLEACTTALSEQSNGKQARLIDVSWIAAMF